MTIQVFELSEATKDIVKKTFLGVGAEIGKSVVDLLTKASGKFLNDMASADGTAQVLQVVLGDMMGTLSVLDAVASALVSKAAAEAIAYLKLDESDATRLITHVAKEFAASVTASVVATSWALSQDMRKELETQNTTMH